MKSSITISVAAALLSGSAEAFWRMPCHSRTALLRLDPIVDKGVASSHVHAIHGGSSKLTIHTLVLTHGIRHFEVACISLSQGIHGCITNQPWARRD
jgi:hypothetical protein